MKTRAGTPTDPCHLHQTVERLEALPQNMIDFVAHLLGCPSCRALASRRLPAGHQRQNSSPSSKTLDYSSIWFLLDLERAQSVQRIAAEREAVFPLLAELLSLSADEQRERVSDPSFLSYALAQQLIDLALAPPAGEAGVSLGRLAVDIAQRLGETFAEPPRVFRDLAVAAHVALGEAWRREGDLTAAEAEFESAARELAGAMPVDRDTRALYCQNLAALRREQDRLDEALALFGHAADLLRDMGEGEAEAWACLELGELALVEALDPARALAAFDTAAAIPELAQRQAFLALAGTVRSLAALDRPDEALQVLALERERFAPGSKEAFEILALKGRLERQLGLLGSARHQLAKAFRGLASIDASREAVSAGVELLQILASGTSGRQALAKVTGKLFELAEKLAPEVREAVHFCLEHSADPRFPRLLRSLADYLERSRLRSKLTFHEENGDVSLPVH